MPDIGWCLDKSIMVLCDVPTVEGQTHLLDLLRRLEALADRPTMIGHDTKLALRWEI